MKMDYIVSRTEASQDGSPYVYVTYSNPDYFKAGADTRTAVQSFLTNMMVFTSPEDLMKDLPTRWQIGKAIGGGGGFPTDSPTFKISIRNYEDVTLKSRRSKLLVPSSS